METGLFTSPGEAAFVLLAEAMELEPHEDLRREMLSRTQKRSCWRDIRISSRDESCRILACFC